MVSTPDLWCWHKYRSDDQEKNALPNGGAFFGDRNNKKKLAWTRFLW